MKRSIFSFCFFVAHITFSQKSDVLRTGLALGDAYLDSTEFVVPTNLPLQKKTDLSQWMPQAGNQGQFASCVSWVIGYGLLGYLEAKAQQQRFESTKLDFPILNDVFGSTVPNIQRVKSPAFIYNIHQLKINAIDCTKGMEYKEGFDIYNESGCPPYAVYPYTASGHDCVSSISKKIINEALKTKKNLFYYNISPKKEMIQQALSKGHIVMLGLNIDTTFNKKNLKSDSVWVPPSNIHPELLSKHAVICVGYDEQYFKLFNSWGHDFGVNGYFYLPKVKSKDFIFLAYIASFEELNLQKIKSTKSTIQKYYDEALNYESKAYSFLEKGKIKDAIKNFKYADKVYPEFHSAFETAIFLEKEIKSVDNQEEQLDLNRMKSIIRQDFNWKVSSENLKKISN